MKAETKSSILVTVCRFSLCFVYCILGALVFMSIEGKDVDNAKAREIYKKIKKNLTEKYDINETVFDIVTKVLGEKKKSLIQEEDQWSFSNSMIFVISIVTTIGYGHIAPGTIGGRMFCIFYALFGIPLCLTMLASVGDLLRIFHMNWVAKVEKYYPLSLSCDAKCAIVCSAQVVIVIFIGAGIHTKIDKWSFETGVYAWFVTFSTIGFGDLIPGYEYIDGDLKFDVKHTFFIIYRLLFDIFGLCVVAALLSSLVKLLAKVKLPKCFFMCLHNNTNENENDTTNEIEMRQKNEEL